MRRHCGKLARVLVLILAMPGIGSCVRYRTRTIRVPVPAEPYAIDPIPAIETIRGLERDDCYDREGGREIPGICFLGVKGHTLGQSLITLIDFALEVKAREKARKDNEP